MAETELVVHATVSDTSEITTDIANTDEAIALNELSSGELLRFFYLYNHPPLWYPQL